MDKPLAQKVQISDNPGVRPLKEALKNPERQIIQHALERAGWNRKKAAADLDINRTTLYNKMREYGLLKKEQEVR